MMMKNKVTTTKVMVIDNGDDESDASNYRIYSNKHPTLNYRPAQISTHPKGRKS